MGPVTIAVSQPYPILRIVQGVMQSDLFVCQRLGREEGSATSDASPGTRWLRVETVELRSGCTGSWDSIMITGFAVHGHSRKRSRRTCLINLDAKPTGKPIAGNRHDGFEVAETGNRDYGSDTEALPEETGSTR